MSKAFLPDGYRAPLSVYEMQRAIEFILSFLVLSAWDGRR